MSRRDRAFWHRDREGTFVSHNGGSIPGEMVVPLATASLSRLID